MNRVAIIGAGPSGLYCAKTLLDGGVEHIDVFERLGMPFGLLRFGVAPDHTTFKRIEELLGTVLEDPRVTFHPGSELGRDINRSQLREDYDAVVYATGAPVDNLLDVPGAELPGSMAAGDLTRWYNGHPDRKAFTVAGITDAVVIGMGNVAMDAARILAAPPGHLAGTKADLDAVSDLDKGAIKHVWIVARRGPEHAAVTTPELKELGKLAGCTVEVLGTTPEQLEALAEEATDRRVKGNLKALAAYAAAPAPTDPERTRVTICFWAKPVEMTGAERVEKLTCERTQLVDGRVTGTGETFEIPAQLVVAALGQHGAPLPDLPDDRGIIANDGGRIVENGAACPGEFVTGWARRGATGIIGAAKADATEVAHLVLHHLGLES